MQKELLETRYALYSTELELEKERGVSQELRMRLRAVTEVATESQQQQTKNQVENVQLRVKYEAMEKQCEFLMSQAVAAKAHEAECKLKIRSLDENLRQKDASNKRMEQALKKLERNSSRIITTIDQYVWPRRINLSNIHCVRRGLFIYSNWIKHLILDNIILHRILHGFISNPNL